MKNITQVLAVTLVSLSAKFAVAVPSLQPRCPDEFRLREPSNSSGFLLDESCKVVYVLPPAIGRVSLANLATSANVELCPAIQTLAETNQEIARTSFEIAKMRTDLVLQKRDRLKNVAALGKERVRVQEAMNAAVARAEMARKQMLEYQNRVEQKARDLSACQSAGRDCQLEAIRAKRAARELSEHRLKSLAPAETDELTARARLAQIEGEVSELKASVLEADDLISELEGQLSETEADLFERYKKYAGLEGGTAQLNYYTETSKLRQEFESLNGGKGLRFESIRPVSSQIYSGVAATQESPIPVPAVLATQVPGLNMASGEAAVLGESASGQIRLSLVGVCGLTKYSNQARSYATVPAKDLAAHLVMKTLYTYEVQAYRRYTARYQLDKLVERIQKSTREGGFFQTRAANELIYRDETSDWFSIDFSGNSGEYEFSREEQAEITREVKADLVNRVLRSLANAFVVGESAKLPDQPGEVQSGASSASASLSKCPHLYCQIGAAVLGVADAAFGSKETVARFLQTVKGESEDRVNGTKMIRYSGSVVFEAK